MVIRSLLGFENFSSTEFIINPSKYKLNPHSSLEVIVNQCIDIDPRLRPTTKKILSEINIY